MTVICKGYYADPEADCQSYHVCSDSGDGIMVKFDFLCPNGTIFNQEEFVCDWWFNVDCSKAEDYYFLNIEVAEKNAERQRQRDNERNTGVRDDRQRTELTADEINELRNSGGLQEKTRTSSNNAFKRPIQPTSATTLTPKRIFSNHFGFSGQAITPFPKHIIGRPKPQSSAVLLRGEKGKKKSRLRKLKNNQPKINQFQPDPFSNFGNGKSRFGNF